MNKRRILMRPFILLMVMVILVGGCSSDMQPSGKTVKVLVGGGGGYYYLFELINSNTVKISQCDVALHKFLQQDEDFIDNVARAKNKRFSKRSKIPYLIETLSKNDSDTEYDPFGEDFSYVWAIIDGKMYWSNFHGNWTNQRHYNQNLLNLLNELEKLVPKDFYS